MDRERFDALARLLATTGSRRQALGVFVGAALAGGAADVLAKRGRRGKKRDKGNNKDKKKDKAKGKNKKRKRRARAEFIPAGCCRSGNCTPGKGKNLNRCCFEDQTLDGKNFSSSNLTDANFRGASLKNANFKSSNLTRVCLVDADITGANFKSANLSGVIRCRTKTSTGIDNSGCGNGTECCQTCIDIGNTCPTGDNGACCFGGICPNGTCVCPPDRPLCAGLCCPAGETCQGGKCVCGNGSSCGSEGVCDNGACVITVSPANMRGWQFYNDQADQEIGPSFESGPGTPPRGSGSAELEIEGNAEGKLLSARIYRGTRLADIAVLKYRTYVEPGEAAPGIAPSLQLGIDFQPNDAHTGWQGRLVYVPGATQTVTQGTWQTWDVLNDGAGTGTGNWWFTRSNVFAEGQCPLSDPCTWTEVLGHFPDIRIHQIGDDPGDGAGIGFIGFKVGSGEGAVEANVDALEIKLEGANEPTVIYNFEPNP